MRPLVQYFKSVQQEPSQEVAPSTRGRRLDKRCHQITWSDEDFSEWFHAFAPTAQEVIGLDPSDSKALHAWADKLVLIGESSFADEGFQSVGSMPFDLFNAVFAGLMHSGKMVKADGSCHDV